MLEHLIATISIGYLGGIVVWILTSIFTTSKKANNLPGGAIASGLFNGYYFSGGNISIAILGAVCGLLGHITMVSFSKMQINNYD